MKIPIIKLKWSRWIPWNRFFARATDSNGVSIPASPGVYEVRVLKNKKPIVIGRSSNLRHRVKQGLVKGKAPHSTGRRVRKNERHRLHHLRVRWATTDRPAAAEEELHRRHRKRFGKLPKYTHST